MLASLVTVLFLNFAFLLVSLVVITDSYTEFADYSKTAFQAMLDLYAAAYEFLATTAIPDVSGLLQKLRPLLPWY